jgi:hypothetical protein
MPVSLEMDNLLHDSLVRLEGFRWCDSVFSVSGAECFCHRPVTLIEVPDMQYDEYGDDDV